MKLFSEEWVQALAGEVRRDAVAQRHMRGIDADFQYVVTPAPARGVEREHAFGIHFRDCVDAWEGLRSGAPFTITVGYGLFHGALTGSVNAMDLLRNRHVSIRGSKAKLLLHGRGVARVLQIAKRIPATAAGEFSDVPGAT